MSTVELTRETDGPGLMQALAEHGLEAELVGDDLSIQVKDCDEGLLAHAIEDWIAQRDLPLVPLRIDDCTFTVGPPAG